MKWYARRWLFCGSMKWIEYFAVWLLDCSIVKTSIYSVDSRNEQKDNSKCCHPSDIFQVVHVFFFCVFWKKWCKFRNFGRVRVNVEEILFFFSENPEKNPWKQKRKLLSFKKLTGIENLRMKKNRLTFSRMRKWNSLMNMIWQQQRHWKFYNNKNNKQQRQQQKFDCNYFSTLPHWRTGNFYIETPADTRSNNSVIQSDAQIQCTAGAKV